MEHKEGVCPNCGSKELKYYDAEVENGACQFEWDCRECKAEGREWHYLKFHNHTFSVAKGASA